MIILKSNVLSKYVNYIFYKTRNSIIMLKVTVADDKRFKIRFLIEIENSSKFETTLVIAVMNYVVASIYQRTFLMKLSFVTKKFT